jgi:hypothetical protein
MSDQPDQIRFCFWLPKEHSLKLHKRHPEFAEYALVTCRWSQKRRGFFFELIYQKSNAGLSISGVTCLDGFDAPMFIHKLTEEERRDFERAITEPRYP